MDGIQSEIPRNPLLTSHDDGDGRYPVRDPNKSFVPLNKAQIFSNYT